MRWIGCFAAAGLLAWCAGSAPSHAQGKKTAKPEPVVAVYGVFGMH